MRILYASSMYWPYIGGMEVHGVSLVSALKSRGYEPMVLTSHAYLDLPDFEVFKDVPVYRLPLYSTIEQRDPRAFLEIRKRVTRLVDEFKPDVLHLNPSDATVLFYLPMVEARATKLIGSLHVPVR